MDLTIIYLFIIVLVVVVAIVTLVVFQGRTNSRVTQILNELNELKDCVNQRQEKDEELTDMVKTIRREQFKNNQAASEIPVENLTHDEETDKHKRTKQKKKKKRKPVANLVGKINHELSRKNTDGEFFIGENIMNKIGIALLALGLGYFVKYAIDIQLINEVGRVAIGVAASGVLLGLAHLLHKHYRNFSSVLLGGAMAILYFTFAIAFYSHQLFGFGVFFIILLIITGFSVFLSLTYQQAELAALATLAAFGALFLVDWQTEGYTTVFIYILVIDLAMLTLAYFKKWLLINLLTFAGTVLVYGLWLVTSIMADKDISYSQAFLFVTIYYFIFLAMYIVNNIKEKRKFLPFELSVIITITIMYYSAGIGIIQQINDAFKGLFTAIISFVNLMFLMALNKNKEVDRGLLSLLFGLALVFLTLVPPVQLVGKSITLVWSLQIVLLLWLAQRIDFALMKLGSILMTIFMVISLGMDMWDIYVHTTELARPMPWFLNIGFITNGVATLALGFIVFLLGKEKGEYYAWFIKVNVYRAVIAMLLLASFYLTFYLEIKYHLIQIIDFEPTVTVIVGLYNYLFILLLMLPMLFINKKAVNIAAGILSLAAFAFYLAYYYYEFISVRNAYLMGDGAKYSHFFMHYIIGLIMIAVVYIGQHCFKRINTSKQWIGLLSVAYLVGVLTTVVSCEIIHIMVIDKYQQGMLVAQAIDRARALPFTILWASVSLVLMIAGIIFRMKNYRIVSLLLFFITLFKLFIYDFRRIDMSSQIIAFIVLGIFLLLISFMYQRLKNIVFDKETK